jgi:hypothetical protein
MFFSRDLAPADPPAALSAAASASATAPDRMVLAGAAVGTLVALLALNLRFIAGTGGRWLHPDNDFNAYLVAWHYFVADRWRLPVFSIPAMGYPEGGSVLFNDALPLTAILTKLLFRGLHVLVNPFGWWILVTYVLQGAMAARVARALGVGSLLGAVCAATFAVCSVPFMTRWFHVALSGHFVVLWAIAVYFESERRQRLPFGQLLLVGVIALLVNPYLFVMVALLGAATVLERWWQARPAWREVAWVGFGLAALAGLAVASGYGVMVTNPASMKSVGFGLYSWNPVSLVVPQRAMWGFSRYFVRDATGGQYEGDTYIGLGALVLLLASLWRRPLWLLTAVRRHPVFVVTLIGFGVWAGSNRLYLGSRLLFVLDLSPRMMDVANYFRASGRFIWPLAYTVMLVPIAIVHRYWRPRVAVPLTLIAIALQLAEAAPLVRRVHAATATTPDALLDSALLTSWITGHQRVWQYPSWACGGLAGVPAMWGGIATNRELQLELLVAQLNVPSNSIYTSRILKDCKQEAAWAARTPRLEPGVLYLLAPGAVAASPALGRLVASAPCTTLGWVTACSTSWSKASASDDRASSIP